MVKLLTLVAVFWSFAAGKNLLPCSTNDDEQCCQLPFLYEDCLEKCEFKLDSSLTNLLKCLSTPLNECLQECLVDASNGTLSQNDSYLSVHINEALSVMIQDEPQFSTALDQAISKCQKTINNIVKVNILGCSTENAGGAMLLCVSKQLAITCPAENIITPN